MAGMEPGKKSRRARRHFTEEFRAGAVRLVLDEGQTVGRVAGDLDLTASALRAWVTRARADRRPAVPEAPRGTLHRGAARSKHAAPCSTAFRFEVTAVAAAGT